MRAAPSCKSAQGPDADRRHKFLIKLGNEGSEPTPVHTAQSTAGQVRAKRCRKPLQNRQGHPISACCSILHRNRRAGPPLPPARCRARQRIRVAAPAGACDRYRLSTRGGHDTGPMEAPAVPVVIVQHEGALCRLLLNRPERGNALGPDVAAALDAGLTEAAEAGARLLVLQGAGRNFCMGFDLSGSRGPHGHRAARTLRQGGVAAATDPRRPDDHARGCYRAHLRGGGGPPCGLRPADRHALGPLRLSRERIRPGPGTSRLAARIGDDAARSVPLDGREINAAEAVTIGLASALVPEDALDGAVAAALSAATRLDGETVAALHRATRAGDSDAALAALVRSASRPGLRDRILRYRDGLRRG